MKRRLLSTMACLFLFMGITMAQTKISGTVISAEDGEPVIGASVIVQGTKQGVATDFDGNFSLTTSVSNPKITVTYIGMEPWTGKGGQNMKITLQPDQSTQRLDEVVVTGMVKMDKRLFTGAATKVDAEKAKLDGVADISRSLEGRAAGVSV